MYVLISQQDPTINGDLEYPDRGMMNNIGKNVVLWRIGRWYERPRDAFRAAFL
jgi:hypothetical protein